MSIPLMQQLNALLQAQRAYGSYEHSLQEKLCTLLIHHQVLHQTQLRLWGTQEIVRGS